MVFSAPLRFAVGVLSLIALGGCGEVQEAERFETAKSAVMRQVTRYSLPLDDGSTIVVDSVSRMTKAQLTSLVLAADRSTKTGCPYTYAVKGLFNGRQGDRIFVTDFYLAWFDFSLADGVGSTRWARSGQLAGFWSLDPNGYGFRNFYDPTGATGGRGNADGICWNWPRNELIVGSNSPNRQQWWWDTYAPPVEHTIVFSRPQAEWTSDPASHYNLFSVHYAQGVPSSGFVRGSDAVQNSAGVHYSTAGLMTSWHGETSFRAVNPANPGNGPVVTGTVSYVLDYSCSDTSIQAVWLFSPSVHVTPLNLYVDVWTGYAGLGRSTTCSPVPAPVPATVYGIPEAGQSSYHSYNTARMSVPWSWIDRNGSLHPVAANGTAAFPWSEAVPCNATALNVGVTAEVASGLPIGATMDLGFASNLSTSGKPYLRMTNLVSPTQGDGSQANPAAFPFRNFVSGYENTDQQQGMLMMSYGTNQLLQGGKWYITSFSISSI